MKLRQKEYCHNCNKHVIFEFDDVTEKQIIICPNCKHEHWRELDGGTIIKIRTSQASIRIAKIPEHIAMDVSCTECDYSKPPEMEYEDRKIQTDEKGNKFIRTGGKVSDRRWGRDPKQGN